MNDLYCWETKFKYCRYSKRLLTKLLLLNKTLKYKIDILKIKKAIYYAKKYHGDQIRQSGEPYYSHPLEVAYLIVKHAVNYVTTDILVTSILHDTLEDTILTKKMIDLIFDPTITAKVEGLTRIKADRKISVPETIKSLWHQEKYDLLLIKQFDRLHNLQTIESKSPYKIKEIISETIEIFIILTAYFGILEIELEFKELCYKFIKPYLIQEPHYLFASEEKFRIPFLAFQNEINHMQNLYLVEKK